MHPQASSFHVAGCNCVAPCPPETGLPCTKGAGLSLRRPGTTTQGGPRPLAALAGVACIGCHGDARSSCRSNVARSRSQGVALTPAVGPGLAVGCKPVEELPAGCWACLPSVVGTATGMAVSATLALKSSACWSDKQCFTTRGQAQSTTNREAPGWQVGCGSYKWELAGVPPPTCNPDKR